ncbi:MAG: TonB-dependent receptor, partial [Bacteroidales bacterium]|nr:TonB-dependent receptor [Bacteroidales bacterium]
ELNYGFYYSTSSDIPRYDRLIQYKNDTTLKYAEWYYGPQKWIMNSLNLKIADSKLLFDDAQITLAWQNIEESRIDRKFQKNDLRTRTEKLDVFSLNLDFDKILNDKNTLFYGFEGVSNIITSEGKIKNITTNAEEQGPTRYPDGDNNYSTIAAYLNFKSNINKKITFQAGTRYNYVFLNSTFQDTTFYDFPFDKIELNTGALIGSIGLVYRPTDKWHLNLNLSSGFRAPNLDDIAKIFDSEPGNVVVPNKDLKPEYAYNIDFGIIKNFTDKARFDITFFYTYLIDAMVRRDFLFDGKDSIIYDNVMSKVQAVVNASTANIYGGCISFFADLTSYFSFKTSLTYTKGEDNDNIPLRHVPPLFGSTGLTYTAEKIKIDLYANYNGVIKNKDLAPSEQDKPFMYATDNNGNPYSPSWFTINIKTSYQLNKYVQLNLGLENIFNNRYRPYSSGIVAPGRNFIIALRACI